MTQVSASSVLRRFEGNPVLSAADVPFQSALVFNAGITRWNGEYVMVFRNDYGDAEERKLRGTNLGLAESPDGIRWTVAPEPVFNLETGEITRSYDPRLTVLDGRLYMCFAADTRHGIRGGLAVTDDLEEFEILSLSVPDNRNMVLFPEKINGRLARLERPFPVYGRGGPEQFDIWYSESPDGVFWGNSELVLGSEQVPWANSKIGPAAPPIKTPEGWLVFFHAVDKEPGREFPSWHGGWNKRYTAGVMLLDLERPWEVLGFCPEPVLVPEAPYELEGYRGGVVFPCGAVLEDDGEVKLYYGAADTVTALARARLEDLLRLCSARP